jgi:hypothetical protein
LIQGEKSTEEEKYTEPQYVKNNKRYEELENIDPQDAEKALL